MAILEFKRPLISTLALCLIACAGQNALLGDQPKEASKQAMPSQFRNKCDAAKGQLRPLIVEWPSTDRASLEALAHHGQVLVHYEGCSLDILRTCTAPEKYKYSYAAITPKDEKVSIKSADELYASIPVHAVSFEGKLAESGELTAQMLIVGLFESPATAPAEDELTGDCSAATHVVQALTVGAFEFFAGNASGLNADANVLGAKAGASRKRGNESLSRDGDPSKCGSSARGNAMPPDGCAALLRLELAPIRPKGADLPTCRSNEKLVGRECKAIEKKAELAPEDVGFADTHGGADWGNKCYVHYKSGALVYARAACEQAMRADPEPKVKSAIAYNQGLIEEASGDVKAACEAYRAALVAHGGNKPVAQKFEKLDCRTQLAQP